MAGQAQAGVTRVVVADQAEARFYDYTRKGPMRPAGTLANANARLHDRDLKSDRPGRLFDRAPPAMGRRGAGSRHSTSSRQSPREHEAEVFARSVVAELGKGLRAGSFDEIVLMAGPSFLGTLRAVMPKGLRESIVAEVPKDLVHEPVSALRAHLPTT